MIHSLNKGKAGEREFAAYLNLTLNCSARRSQQYAGGHDSADIFDKAMPDIHWETKRVESLNLEKAYTQALGDAGDKLPIVAHRRNRQAWMVTFKASDIKRFVDIVSKHLNKSLADNKQILQV